MIHYEITYFTRFTSWLSKHFEKPRKFMRFHGAIESVCDRSSLCQYENIVQQNVFNTFEY